MKLQRIKVENKAYCTDSAKINHAAKRLYKAYNLKGAFYNEDECAAEFGVAQMSEKTYTGDHIVSIIAERHGYDYKLKIYVIHHISLNMYKDTFPVQCGMLGDVLLGYIDQYCTYIETKFAK